MLLQSFFSDQSLFVIIEWWPKNLCANPPGLSTVVVVVVVKAAAIILFQYARHIQVFVRMYTHCSHFMLPKKNTQNQTKKEASKTLFICNSTSPFYFASSYLFTIYIVRAHPYSMSSKQRPYQM